MDQAPLGSLDKPNFIEPFQSIGRSRPSVTFFTNEGSEYVDPLAGRVTTTFPSSSNDQDFAFLADLARDGSTEVDTGVIPFWVAATLALLCLNLLGRLRPEHQEGPVSSSSSLFGTSSPHPSEEPWPP